MAEIEANGIRMECDVLGDEQAPAILLIRGLGTQMCQWPQTFLDGLVDAGLRVVRFDNRDVGLSQKFTEAGTPNLAELMATMRSGERPETPYTLDAMADDGPVNVDDPRIILPPKDEVYNSIEGTIQHFKITL